MMEQHEAREILAKVRSYDVTYRFIECHHVFTSKSLPGLYIVSKDAVQALADIPVVVEFLEKEAAK